MVSRVTISVIVGSCMANLHLLLQNQPNLLREKTEFGQFQDAWQHCESVEEGVFVGFGW